ncbi:lipid-A-disaccharide synthase [Psittacicella gerlachiana]|uniref:Lipid-A-disaccharide synthase n=1 Tax=Psittacicella gerlachiana TaxID=2028574 RepID=A0A3A1Y9W8_9GAMM|nr:hypothetical protein [Psittacicella gerlachiana]RIY34952.1 hypothetical protein CKF59_04420 [Psittacicella gerlachiana]
MLTPLPNSGDLQKYLEQIPPHTKICIVAGEVSGDQLGAGLVAKLKSYRPDLQFVGIGGDLMREQGVETWYDISDLSYFGVVDVVLSLPKILRVISRTKALLKESQAQMYIGIDNPDFNLRLETYAKTELKIKTIQYVSPSVWAWRQGRVETIKQACDLVLCLLPFEKEFFDRHQQAATFVGHRLANKLGENLQQDAKVYEKLLIEASQQQLFALTGGKISVSQAKRLMEANQKQAEQKPEASLIEATSTDSTPQETSVPASASKVEASNSSLPPETSKNNLILQHGQASINKELDDLVLGIDGNYYLTLTPEQVKYLQTQNNLAAKANSTQVRATAEAKTKAEKTATKTSLDLETDFLNQGKKIQAFVASLPSAQQAQQELALAQVYNPQQQACEPESQELRIAVLPGSRTSEVELIFAWYLSGIRHAIAQGLLPKTVELLVPIAKDKLKDDLLTIAADYPDLNLKFVDGHAHQVLQTSAFALVSSGTATLDTLLCHTPMLVGYRLSSLNFFLAKRLIKVPYISLANVIMENEIAKELIQDDLTPENISEQIKSLLNFDYNQQIRLIYFLEHLALQKDSDTLAAQATLALLAQN